MPLFANYALEAINKELLLFPHDNAETAAYFDDDNKREFTVFAQANLINYVANDLSGRTVVAIMIIMHVRPRLLWKRRSDREDN